MAAQALRSEWKFPGLAPWIVTPHPVIRDSVGGKSHHVREKVELLRTHVEVSDQTASPTIPDPVLSKFPPPRLLFLHVTGC